LRANKLDTASGVPVTKIKPRIYADKRESEQTQNKHNCLEDGLMIDQFLNPRSSAKSAAN